MAIISGLAAASALGAPYPFGHDKLAKLQFDTYVAVAYGGMSGRAVLLGILVLLALYFLLRFVF